MTEPLTEQRFIELAEAYGGVIARWPEAVRAQAMELAQQPHLQAVLAEAGRLDARLDLWAIAAPAPELAARIAGARRRPFSRRARAWWSGIGIATALAGAAAGSVAAAVAAPPSHVISDEATAFGDLGQEN